MNVENGIYAVGLFVELTREKRLDRETGKEFVSDYAIITTGGRRGTLALKFKSDSISPDTYRALTGMKLGDDFVGKVSVSAYNGAAYYTLEDIPLAEDGVAAFD